ncbi:GTP-binding protein [Actinokineospora spheciospongiae]|uniref:GTP-binding protein n=1 Tax=Actinokineospora spheciospongiae TaxID=909613 RepID=UPI000D82B2A9|nr:GTP-binding protein [Actinokineospora spheciospongiae]PWW65592.1 G3E family GTPase [Actinokineospora spheciospongiae]
MLTLVAGWDRAAAGAFAARLLAPGTAVVQYAITDSGVERRCRVDNTDTTERLGAEHDCVSCTLRADLALLTDAFDRLVVHLDPVLEPGPIARERQVDAVVTVVDVDTWLAAATGDDLLPDDERTVAQVVVGQVEAADALVLTGAPDARTTAVLDRLAAAVPRVPLAEAGPALLRAVRRGDEVDKVDEVFGPLLRGQPPLRPECGVGLTVFRERRPFDQDRLVDALDVLLDGVVRARGRVWVAGRPDEVLLLESAGGGVCVGPGGTWLAASDDWDAVSAERRARAALDWDPVWGDRVQELVILSHAADPEALTAAFTAALVQEEIAL